MRTLTMVLAILIAGCAANDRSSSSLRADAEAMEQYENTAKRCARQGGVVMVRMTDSRIRKRMARDKLQTAQCTAKP